MKIRVSITLSMIMVNLFFILCLTSLSHSVQFRNTNWVNSESLFTDGISGDWLYPADSFWVTTSYPWASLNQVYRRFDLNKSVHVDVFDSYINLLNYRNNLEPAWSYSRKWQQSNFSFYQNYLLYSALNYVSGYLLSWRYPFGFKKKKPKPSGALEAYNPVIDSAHFVEIIDNPYWPLTPGTTYTYLGETEEDPETIVVEVLDEIRLVMGVTWTVVRDQVYLDGELIEDTHDWYAQDDEGNVWYFGEDSKEYKVCEEEEEEEENDDECISTTGSWEAGVGGALPGIIMKAQPQVGESYRQEYYEGEAEDMAVVISLEATVELEDGTMYNNSLQTLEWTPLEPDALEYKYYAPDIGLVMEKPLGDEEWVELQGIESP